MNFTDPLLNDRNFSIPGQQKIGISMLLIPIFTTINQALML